MMNILQIAPVDPAEPGGVETHVRELSYALARRGHRIVMLAAGTSRRNETFGAEGGAVRYRIMAHPAGLAHVPPAGWAQAVRAAAAQADIVHLHSYHRPHAAVAHLALMRPDRGGAEAGAEAALRAPQILTAHYHGGGHSRAADLAHPVWRATLGGMLVRRVDRNISVSTAEARLLHAHHKTSATVIPNGASPRGTSLQNASSPGAPSPWAEWPEVRPYGIRDGTTVILTVARQTDYKRTSMLIDAVLTDPALTLVVAGDGPALAGLRRRAALHAGAAGTGGAGGGAGRVHLLGRVDEATLERLWARADVYASASSREAYGISAGEAAVTGLPAVLSDLDAHKEAYGPTGIYLPEAAGPHHWAAAMRAAAGMGRREQDLSRGWDTIAGKVEQVYLEAAGQARTRPSRAHGARSGGRGRSSWGGSSSRRRPA